MREFTQTERRCLGVHMSNAARENRLDPDVWSGPTRMLHWVLCYAAAGFVLATFVIIGVMLS